MSHPVFQSVMLSVFIPIRLSISLSESPSKIKEFVSQSVNQLVCLSLSLPEKNTNVLRPRHYNIPLQGSLFHIHPDADQEMDGLKNLVCQSISC